MKASSSWLRTSTRALPIPTTSKLGGLVGSVSITGAEAVQAPAWFGHARPWRPAQVTGTAGPVASSRGQSAPPAAHGPPAAVRAHAHPRPRSGDLRGRSRHRRRRGRGHPRGGAQRHRAGDRPGLGRGRRRAGRPTTVTLDEETERATLTLAEAAPAGRRGGVAAVPGPAQRQAPRLLPLDLHRRRRRRAGDRHHPVRGHRRPSGVPVLGRARLQGPVRHHAASSTTTSTRCRTPPSSPTRCSTGSAGCGSPTR